MADCECCGSIIAYTLRPGTSGSRRSADEIVALYDERFYRLWLFYLAAALSMFSDGGMSSTSSSICAAATPRRSRATICSRTRGGCAQRRLTREAAHADCAAKQGNRACGCSTKCSAELIRKGELIVIDHDGKDYRYGAPDPNHGPITRPPDRQGRRLPHRHVSAGRRRRGLYGRAAGDRAAARHPRPRPVRRATTRRASGPARSSPRARCARPPDASPAGSTRSTGRARSRAQRRAHLQPDPPALRAVPRRGPAIHHAPITATRRTASSRPSSTRRRISPPSCTSSRA